MARLLTVAALSVAAVRVVAEITESADGTRRIGLGSVEWPTECYVTEDEPCDMAGFITDESTLVYPGGETRCIYSEELSGEFAFQVRRVQQN